VNLILLLIQEVKEITLLDFKVLEFSQWIGKQKTDEKRFSKRNERRKPLNKKQNKERFITQYKTVFN
jgi:hypothetical protein